MHMRIQHRTRRTCNFVRNRANAVRVPRTQACLCIFVFFHFKEHVPCDFDPCGFMFIT